jgi:hypothetical protein
MYRLLAFDTRRKEARTFVSASITSDEGATKPVIADSLIQRNEARTGAPLFARTRWIPDAKASRPVLGEHTMTTRERLVPGTFACSVIEIGAASLAMAARDRLSIESPKINLSFHE